MNSRRFNFTTSHYANPIHSFIHAIHRHPHPQFRPHPCHHRHHDHDPDAYAELQHHYRHHQLPFLHYPNHDLDHELFVNKLSPYFYFCFIKLWGLLLETRTFQKNKIICENTRLLNPMPCQSAIITKIAIMNYEEKSKLLQIEEIQNYCVCVVNPRVDIPLPIPLIWVLYRSSPCSVIIL